jgi:hypothetical protein
MTYIESLCAWQEVYSDVASKKPGRRPKAKAGIIYLDNTFSRFHFDKMIDLLMTSRSLQQAKTAAKPKSTNKETQDKTQYSNCSIISTRVPSIYYIIYARRLAPARMEGKMPRTLLRIDRLHWLDWG